MESLPGWEGKFSWLYLSCPLSRENPFKTRVPEHLNGRKLSVVPLPRIWIFTSFFQSLDSWVRPTCTEGSLWGRWEVGLWSWGGTDLGHRASCLQALGICWVALNFLPLIFIFLLIFMKRKGNSAKFSRILRELNFIKLSHSRAADTLIRCYVNCMLSARPIWQARQDSCL